MKKIYVFLALAVMVQTAYAQTPEGIIYQAEARDNAGNIIENESLEVKINVLQDDADGVLVWEGLHSVTTNKYGMFVLVIGSGTNNSGSNFEEIKWGSNSHFLNVQVKTLGAFNWVDMGTTQFLSVPYAFHAKTAGSVVGDINLDLKSAGPGVPSQTWSLFGNSKSDPEKDKMGTTDATDLVFVTDNKERLRITKDGLLITPDGVGLDLGGNLKVRGDSTTIDKDIFVGRNVYLNFNDSIEPHGQTFNGGNFTVENKSSTLLTGTLNVDSITTITDTTQSTAIDNGAVVVNGGTGIARNLNVGEDFSVHGQSQFDTDINVDGRTITNKLVVDTMLNPDPILRKGSIVDIRGILVADSIILSGGLVVGGNLKVEGDSVIISKDLYVHGTTNLTGDLNLTKSDTGFVATFFNKNEGRGDGIRISLGKKATKHSSGFAAIDSTLKKGLGQGYGPTEFSGMKGLFDGDLVTEDFNFLISLATPNPEDLDAIAVSVCKLSEQVSRLIFEEMNKTLKQALTISIPELSVTIPKFLEIDLGTIKIPGTPKELFSAPDIIPDLPVGDAIDFGCGDIGNNFILPELEFTDQADVLNKKNTFIEFTDGEDDWKMGAITAQSIDEWASQYLDPVFLYGLYSTFQGLDRAKAFPEMRKIAKEVATSYLAIGVQYGSGNGDYAEWLERFDHSEYISAGDIVAVKGGKITKDLRDAEQIMAVSEKPIVLGNIPEEGMGPLGNNVAFMGQIPVKIMGPVATGDYIVGTSEIPGYGVAISAQNMTIEDFKFAVGRSWDANADNGPKMVNTVVGVHNGDYLNILKRYEQKFRESEARLESVEAKIDALSTLLPQAQNSK